MIGLDDDCIADPSTEQQTEMQWNVSFKRSGLSEPFIPYSCCASDRGLRSNRYAAKTSHIDWAHSRRWGEFQGSTIGSDRFPTYDLYELHTGARFADGLDTDLDSLKVASVSRGCHFGFTGTSGWQEVWAYDALGKFLGLTDRGTLTLALKPGDNVFGLYLMGTAADTQDHYLDFKWMLSPPSQFDFICGKSGAVTRAKTTLHFCRKDRQATKGWQGEI
jgi:hypothetical protein